MGRLLPQSYPAEKVSPRRQSHSPTSPKTQHTHGASYLGDGSPVEGGPLERSAPGGARAQGHGPAPAADPVSSFSPALFLTQPPAPRPERKLHNPLGAANVAEDYSRHPERLSHPQVYPTQGTPSSSLTNPGLQASGSAPASSQTAPLTATTHPRGLDSQGSARTAPHTKMGRHRAAMMCRNLLDPVRA